MVVRKVVSISIRNVVIHYFTHAKSLTMSIFCNIIFSCTKGSVTAEESFEVLLFSILQSEKKGGDFEETLQELKEWPFQGYLKKREPGRERRSCTSFKRKDV